MRKQIEVPGLIPGQQVSKLELLPVRASFEFTSLPGQKKVQVSLANLGGRFLWIVAVNNKYIAQIWETRANDDSFMNLERAEAVALQAILDDAEGKKTLEMPLDFDF